MDIMNADVGIVSVGTLRSLVRDIRGHIASADQTEDPELRGLWEQYVSACAAMNTRLDQCTQFFQRGEWLEAVRHAELEPDVLECCGIIDFEERDHWEQLGTDFGWERLVPIDYAQVEQLSEAWDNRKQLKPLLRKHIRLALSNASLSDRLNVMRQLHSKDRFSTFWRDDIRDFERVRIPELIRELKAATAAGDFGKSDEVLNELTSTPWVVKLPKSVLSVMNKCEAHVLLKDTLPAVSEELCCAFNANDEVAGLSLLQQWRQYTDRIAEFGAADRGFGQLVDATSQAEVWAGNVERRNQLLSECDLAAADLVNYTRQFGCKRSQVEARYQHYRSLENQLDPADVDKALSAKVEAAYAKGKRKALLDLFLATAGILGAVFGILFIVFALLAWLAGGDDPKEAPAAPAAATSNEASSSDE